MSAFRRYLGASGGPRRRGWTQLIKLARKGPEIGKQSNSRITTNAMSSLRRAGGGRNPGTEGQEYANTTT
eukprot:6706886-Pyramimonas_sp.AAC.1